MFLDVERHFDAVVDRLSHTNPLLLLRGKYNDIKNVYSKKIQIEPTQYFLCTFQIDEVQSYPLAF